MGSNVKDLCRLCAQKNEFSKDLLDENNKSVLDLIRQFTQISVNECENMPTKVCLDCEDKMVSFQLFILECYKAQDTLRKIYLEKCDESFNIKLENSDADFGVHVIKSEFPVKDELTADDLVSAINNDTISEYDEVDFQSEADDDDDDMDNLTIASLKQMKLHKKPPKKKEITEEQAKEFKSVLQKSVLRVKDFVRFICPICDKRCSSWYTLKSHCERLHKTPPVVTCSCGITLKSKSVMYKHIQDHKNPCELSCDQCSLVAKSVDALNKHKLKHVPKSERKFVCSRCDKEFPSKDAMRSHEKSHIPIDERKVFHCDVCNLKFTTRSSAASHKRVVHDKIKSYVCDLCGYACGTNGELRQHRAIHSDDKPFACRKCSKAFKTYSNLKTHMDTHEDTSYACYVCSRVLNSRRTLRKHLLVHEDKLRHVCSYCNKAFKRRQTLKVHMYTHTGDKPLSCKWCDERFAYASTLRSHRLRCHPDKMAAQAHGTYHNNYNSAAHVRQEDYIKIDLAAIGVTKNEVEAM